jgi:agmatine/peptidylarginine deiminase
MSPVDKDSNMVYFSEWIKNFTCYESIIEKLNRNQIKFDLLPFTNDYWVRDFMPIQISETEFIEYKYNPDYLQSKPTYITNPKDCCNHLDISTKKIDVVLDGGNIIKCTDAIILTDKVFVENRNLTKTQLIDTLENAFQCNIIVIPWDRNEKYGHADGMVRFIEKKKILLNNYINFDILLRNKLIKALDSHFDIVELDYKVDKCSLLNWSYINYLQVGSFILLPAIGAAQDKQAHKQFSNIFNRHQIEQIDVTEIVKQGGALNCISWNIKI